MVYSHSYSFHRVIHSTAFILAFHIFLKSSATADCCPVLNKNILPRFFPRWVSWSKIVESKTVKNHKNSTDVLYIDFSRSFDSVVHNKLLIKLESYGIGYELYDWLQNFLSDRSQMAVVGGFQSDSVTVESGVPQGSVIGPTMFILFVNDILDKLPSSTVSCKLFADDVKLYSNVEIFTVSSLHDALALVNAWSIE